MDPAVPAAASLTIRAAVPSDAPGIAAVHARAWQRAYRGIVPDDYLAALTAKVDERARWWHERLSGMDPALHVWLAFSGDCLAGFCTTGPSRDDDVTPHTGEVRAIYLDPEMAGRGIGRALFAHAVADLCAQGYRAATLWVLRENHLARRFYEAAGWRPDGAAKTEHRPGFDLHEMRYRVAL